MSEETKSKISLKSAREPFWAMSAEETFAALNSGPQGLSEEEAWGRLKIFGPNAVTAPRRLAQIKIVWRQLTSPLILVLIAAGALTLFLQEFVEAGVIMAAVILNIFLGFWQENKAENVLELLKGYIRARTRVRRSGREREIDASELVPGDIIRVSQGDRVPADCRLVFANNFEADESILTGESLPAEKNPATIPPATALAERKSLVFGGTLAVSGFAEAAVTATGDKTEFGRIASLVAVKEKESTPLQRSITRFTVRAGLILGGMSITLFLVGLSLGRGLYEMFLIAVAVAVSAVPEGLPIALTVVLAIGVERLAGRKGVVRRLLAAETLGSTSRILTDKTGTLTQAKMELTATVPYQGGSEEKKLILRDALLNTDVIIENPQDPPSSWRIVGKALETALVKGAVQEGILLPQVFKEAEILDRLPFSSAHKFSACIIRQGPETRLILLGAPEALLKQSSLLGETERAGVLQEVDRRAYGGERILGIASRRVLTDHEDILHGRKFQNLEFRGLLSFRDPLRPGVSDAVRRIGRAGVKTIILTGDHQGTAEAVARELGMIDGKGAVLTGDDLNYLTEEEIAARSSQVSVYARVTPEQKLMVAKLYQEQGETVAVIGDGVNDAPALETADIGVAVGSGTDVAKSAADLVILDDNFETIVAAIEEGRKISDNVRKVIVYLLSDSLDELLLIGGALLAGLTLPINALQILFVNFFSDSFPAIALAFEKGIDGLGFKPRRLERNLFDPQMRFLILVIGALTSFLLFVLYWAMLRFGFPQDLTRTFIFASFATYTLFLAFSVRSLEKSILSYNPFSNHYLVGGVAIGLFLTALVIYLPFFREVFDTAPLPPIWILAVATVGMLNIAAVEFSKWLFRRGAL